MHDDEHNRDLPPELVTQPPERRPLAPADRAWFRENNIPIPEHYRAVREATRSWDSWGISSLEPVPAQYVLRVVNFTADEQRSVQNAAGHYQRKMRDVGKPFAFMSRSVGPDLYLVRLL